MTRYGYSFGILQYRHDVWTGEALNVGVLVACPDAGYLAFRGRNASGRILRAYPDLRRSSLTKDIKEVERAVSKIQRLDQRGGLFREFDLSPTSSEPNQAKRIAYKVIKHDDSSLVWSIFGTGTTDNPDRTLQELHQRFVMRYEKSLEKEGRSDEQVFEPFKQKLEEAGILRDFTEETITSRLVTVEFKHTIRNARLHCVQPLSLDLLTAEGMEEKASRWTGTLYHLRQNEGQFKTYFLVGAPISPQLRTAFEKSIAMLRSAPTDPVVVREDDSAQLVDRLVNVARH